MKIQDILKSVMSKINETNLEKPKYTWKVKKSHMNIKKIRILMKLKKDLIKEYTRSQRYNNIWIKDHKNIIQLLKEMYIPQTQLHHSDESWAWRYMNESEHSKINSRLEIIYKCSEKVLNDDKYWLTEHREGFHWDSNPSFNQDFESIQRYLNRINVDPSPKDIEFIHETAQTINVWEQWHLMDSIIRCIRETADEVTSNRLYNHWNDLTDIEYDTIASNLSPGENTYYIYNTIINDQNIIQFIQQISENV